jgi:hypothetical protein
LYPISVPGATWPACVIVVIKSAWFGCGGVREYEVDRGSDDVAYLVGAVVVTVDCDEFVGVVLFFTALPLFVTDFGTGEVTEKVGAFTAIVAALLC